MPTRAECGNVVWGLRIGSMVKVVEHTYLEGQTGRVSRFREGEVRVKLDETPEGWPPPINCWLQPGCLEMLSLK